MTPRQQRLVNEYNGLLKLKDQSNGIFDFTVDNNYAKYSATIKEIKTLVGATEKYNISDHHAFTIELVPGFPVEQPKVKFAKTLFHPNWWPDGTVCYGKQWTTNNTLAELIIDTVKMMVFDLANTSSPANRKANEWYSQNKKTIRNMIPKIQFPPQKEESKVLASRNDELEFL